MATNKTLNLTKNVLLITMVGALLAACNGGGSLASDTDQATGGLLKSSANAPVTDDTLGDEVCVSASFDLKGNLNLTNACHSAQLLTQANIKFVSQDTHGHQIILNKFYNNTSGLGLEFSSGGANQQIGTFTADNQALAINGDTTLTFSGSVSRPDSDPFDYNWANKTLDLSILGDNKATTADISSISTAAAVSDDSSLKSVNSALASNAASTGFIELDIDTLGANCAATDCSAITTQIVNTKGAVVNSVTVPAEYLGKTYRVTIPNVAPGDYRVVASTVKNTKIVSKYKSSIRVESGYPTRDTLMYVSTLGSVKIKVNYSAQYRGDSHISLVNSNGVEVAGLDIPRPSNQQPDYIGVIKNVPRGNYSVVARSTYETRARFSPVSQIVKVVHSGSDSPQVDFNYVTNIGAGTGVARLTLDYAGTPHIPVPVTVIDAANSNQVMYSGLISKWGPLVAPMGLEPTTGGSTNHSYKVCLPMGIANPTEGMYLIQPHCQDLLITKDGETSLALETKPTAVKLSKISLAIQGLATGDTATSNFTDQAGKYVYAPLTMGSNGTKLAYFEDKSNINISTSTTTQSTGYNINPIVTSLRISSDGEVVTPFSLAQNPGVTVNQSLSYNYANNTLMYVPVDSFGLISYVFTNTTNEILSDMKFHDASNYPADITIDPNRTTCACPDCSSTTSVQSLAPNQSCVVVFKYQPTSYGISSSFNYGMAFVGESSQKIFETPLISTPFSSRPR